MGSPITNLDEAIAHFHEEHGREHNYSRPGAAVEVYRVSVVATGVTPKAKFAEFEPVDAPAVPVGARKVRFDELPEAVETPVYDRAELKAGMKVGRSRGHRSAGLHRDRAPRTSSPKSIARSPSSCAGFPLPAEARPANRRFRRNSMASTDYDLDPVTFEVLKNAYVNIVRPDGGTDIEDLLFLRHMVARLSSALCDVNGDTIMQGSRRHRRPRWNARTIRAKAVINAFKGDIHPGDALRHQ